MIKIITGSTLQSLAKRLSLITFVLVLSACGAINKPFNPINDKQTFKSSSIAVISGSHHAGDMQLAGFVTKGLDKRSTFRVLSQDDIEKRLVDYPALISIRDDIKDDDEKPVWFKPSEKAKLNAMRNKLKVDYLFVIWNYQMTLVTSRNGSTYYVYPIGNLIEYPSNNVVASTRSVDSSSTSILALFRSEDYYIVDALESASNNIVDKFLDVTKSRK